MYFQRLARSKACSDAGLLDSNVFQRSLQFYSSACEFLLLTMKDAVDGQKGVFTQGTTGGMVRNKWSLIVDTRCCVL